MSGDDAAAARFPSHVRIGVEAEKRRKKRRGSCRICRLPIHCSVIHLRHSSLILSLSPFVPNGVGAIKAAQVKKRFDRQRQRKTEERRRKETTHHKPLRAACNKRRCLLSPVLSVFMILWSSLYSSCSRKRREIYEINSYYYAAQGKNTITTDHFFLACAILFAAKFRPSKTFMTREDCR